MAMSNLEKARFLRDNPGYRAAVAIYRTCQFCHKGFKTDWAHRDANCCCRCADVAKLKQEVAADKAKMEQVELLKLALRG
jgi:hypothetical protein